MDNAIRTEKDDPRRCQGVSNKGQCQLQAIEGVKHCKIHGGANQATALAGRQADMYRLTKYQSRMNELSNHDQVKGLRSEIGILRILMEERLNSIGGPLELMTEAPIIGDLAMKIERLVSSCQKIEGAMGQLMDKQALLQFADVVVRIIGDEIEDADILTRVANKIMAALGNTNDTTSTDSSKDS